MLNEEGWWRLVISAAIGLAVAAVISIIRDPKGPVAAGVAAGAAAYAIDWYTEYGTRKAVENAEVG